MVNALCWQIAMVKETDVRKSRKGARRERNREEREGKRSRKGAVEGQTEGSKDERTE